MDLLQFMALFSIVLQRWDRPFFSARRTSASSRSIGLSLRAVMLRFAVLQSIARRSREIRLWLETLSRRLENAAGRGQVLS
jgi:hypothetical protein